MNSLLIVFSKIFEIIWLVGFFFLIYGGLIYGVWYKGICKILGEWLFILYM